ncbi:hypothetical protein BDW60DRAFT_186088 [Aspergillus nidulans var. acristatus]
MLTRTGSTISVIMTFMQCSDFPMVRLERLQVRLKGPTYWTPSHVFPSGHSKRQR